MRWTLLTDPIGHPGWWQMALDQALLDEAARTGEGVVRFYRWRPWAISFGRHESALRRYDRTRVEALGIDTVRRPTGGRAVWHAREFTYAVVAPVVALGGLAQSYQTIHATLAEGIRSLGVSVTLAPPGQPTEPGAGACFSSAAGGEMLCLGRKLGGSAQLRQGDVLLQHGSLLLEDNQRLLRELALRPMPAGTEITLREAAGRIVSFAELATAIAAELGSWGGTWRDDATHIDQERLVAREAPRFRDAAWTWRR
jgi:lipoyl(octanoyl) transferase